MDKASDIEMMFSSNLPQNIKFIQGVSEQHAHILTTYKAIKNTHFNPINYGPILLG